MDPQLEMAGDIRSMTPVVRAREMMERSEAEEARQAEVQRYNREMQAEAVARNTLARQRAEIYTRGYTSEQLNAWNTEREQVRQAKIDEHLAELRRLDPARFGDAGVRRYGFEHAADAEAAAAVLRRARQMEAECGGFMRRMVAEYDERRFGPERAAALAEMARLERLTGAGPHPDIVR